MYNKFQLCVVVVSITWNGKTNYNAVHCDNTVFYFSSIFVLVVQVVSMIKRWTRSHYFIVVKLCQRWSRSGQPLRQLSYLSDRSQMKSQYDAVVIGAGITA